MNTLRQSSRQRVVDAIAREDGISRPDLSKELNLSTSTISNIVRELIRGGTVQERPTQTSSGGRPRNLLFHTRHMPPIWVADIGQSSAKIGVTDRRGTIRAQDVVNYQPTQSPAEIIAAIVAELTELSRRTFGKTQARAFGLSLCGPVDRASHRVLGAARLTGWNNLDLLRLVQAHGKFPTIFENDARAEAWGELSIRENSNPPREAIYLKADIGIGGASIINGSVYEGGNGLAGDITHNIVTTTAASACSCGRSGCLETVASGAGIIQQLAHQGVYIDSLKELVDRANQWDPVVTPLVRAAGTQVGKVIAPMVTFLSPSMVICGGGLSSCDSFNAALRTELYSNCLPIITAEIAIEEAKAGPNAALLGLVELCLRAEQNQN